MRHRREPDHSRRGAERRECPDPQPRSSRERVPDDPEEEDRARDGGQGRQELHGLLDVGEVEEVPEAKQLSGDGVPAGRRVVAPRRPELVLEHEVAGVAQMLGSVDAGNRGEDEGIADSQRRRTRARLPPRRS